MRTRVQVAAHAKVNLLLRIGPRDATGYHQLETLFCALALADAVTVEVGAAVADALEVSGPALPPGGLGPRERNLAWRALAAYRAASGWPGGAAISIEKRIPVGGGLGGGSADAAAVLRALDAAAPHPIGADGLAALGATLGADVPFLVHGAPLAWAWGRGDRLLTLPPLPSRPVLLLPQAEGVPTADAYRWLAEAGGGTAYGAARYATAVLADWDAVARLAHNDFTPVVAARHAGVRAALAQLDAVVAAARSGGAAAAFSLMSGSGATCFAVLPAGPDAAGAAGSDVAGGVWTRTLDGVVGLAEVG